jgi:periplasmic protein TonB
MKPQEFLQADMLDIVFENRNKSYGAYSLRKDYNHRMVLALSGMMALVLTFILYTSFRKPNKEKPKNSMAETVLIQQVELPNNKKMEEPKPQNKPQTAARQQAAVKYTNKIKMVAQSPDTIPDQREIDRKNIDTKPKEGDIPVGSGTPKGPAQDLPGDSPVVPDPPKEKEPEVFTSAEVMPTFPGGLEALKAFLERYLKSPRDLEEGEHIKVKVKFVVNENGSVTGMEIVQSGGNEFDREVMRVMNKMPAWEAGKENGRKVKVYFTIPVSFASAE